MNGAPFVGGESLIASLGGHGQQGQEAALPPVNGADDYGTYAQAQSSTQITVNPADVNRASVAYEGQYQRAPSQPPPHQPSAQHALRYQMDPNGSSSQVRSQLVPLQEQHARRPMPPPGGSAPDYGGGANYPAPKRRTPEKQMGYKTGGVDGEGECKAILACSSSPRQHLVQSSLKR